MLILSRRISEVIQIGSDISVVVLGVNGCQVRLGVEAPKGVPVDRKEIAERKAAGLPKPAPAVESALPKVDPRDLFIAANPIGASADELEKGPVSGFVDDRTHADYMIFLAGFNAAQVGQEVPHGL